MTFLNQTNLTNQTTKTSKSPLGDASSYYRVKRSEQGSIVDRPEQGMIELYPAGSTKPSTQEGSRQAVLRNIYEKALEIEAEDKLFPFGKKGHHIVLHPQKDNRYDPHAVLLTLSAPEDSCLYSCDGKDIGFIPKRISKLIHENWHCFYDGLIYKVKSNVYGKYYQAKIVLLYGDEFSRAGSSMSMGRFVNLLEE